MKKKLESAQRIMKEIEDDSIRIDQLPLCNLYFREPLKNATGCDLFNSSGYKQTERFHLRLGCPTKVPKERTGTHTHTNSSSTDGVAVGSCCYTAYFPAGGIIPVYTTPSRCTSYI